MDGSSGVPVVSRMQSGSWHVTEDINDFLLRTGDFLRSRPALHNSQLTGLEKLRTCKSDAGNADATLFGRLELGGEVRAVFYRRPSGLLGLTPLSADQADGLATFLVGLGRTVSRVSAEHGTAAAFAESWQRHANATPTFRQLIHLYRLGTLTPPEPQPDGRGRAVGEEDREQLIRLCGEFCEAVGEVPAVDAGSWDGSRFADRHFTFWEDEDGTPVSLAASTTMIAGMVRVDPVYTPAEVRGRGYAGAVTVAVSRAALAAGATEVVLYTDPANTTSNALYQRIGYVPLADFAVYDFSADL